MGSNGITDIQPLQEGVSEVVEWRYKYTYELRIELI